MTDERLDRLIRDALADRADNIAAATASADAMAERIATRLRPSPAGRGWVLLAATFVLVAALGTAIAVGSGLLRLPLVVDDPEVEPTRDLGIFEPVAGWIVRGNQLGMWGVDPEDRSRTVKLTSRPGTPLEWSNDGTRLLVRRDQHLLVLHADGSETQVTPDSLDPLAVVGATISPDGSRVVFATIDGQGDTGFLFSVDADGGPAKVLLELDGLEGVSFSPDGTRIVYVSGHGDGDHRVSVMDADGSNVREIVANDVTLDAGHDHGIAWSPAGDRIALGIEGSIYTFAPDGSGFTVALVVGRWLDPFWSPDGSQLETTGPWHPGNGSDVPRPNAGPPTDTPSTLPETEAVFEIALHYYGVPGNLIAVPERVRIRAPLPDGGVANESGLTLRSEQAEDSITISLWAVDAVFSDPCARSPADPPLMHALDFLAEALTGWWLPRTGMDSEAPPDDLPTATRPTSTTVSGFRARYLELRIPGHMEPDECFGGRYATWKNPDGEERHHQPGDVSRIWIVEVGEPPLLHPAPSGREGGVPAERTTPLLVIDATSSGELSPDALRELDVLIGSIVIEAPVVP